MDISVVHRSDESGTTFVFTYWLPREPVLEQGHRRSGPWPTGRAATATTALGPPTQTEGSIGYLSYDFAASSDLGVASIKRDDVT